MINLINITKITSIGEVKHYKDESENLYVSDIILKQKIKN